MAYCLSLRFFNLKESLIKSFDKALVSVVEGLRTNGNGLIPFVVNRELVERSNHERDQLTQSFLNPKLHIFFE